MILIAGGSGRLGTVVVHRLKARGLPIRVLTRDRTRARHLVSPQIEIVEGDVRNPESLARAVIGADTVVSLVHGFAGQGRVSPASVDRDGNINLIAAARSVQAAVVLMSIVGASATHSLDLFRMKHEAETYLRASTVPWTIVRATAFMELWIDVLDQTARRSGRPLVFGRGDNPINFVSVEDVAALIVRVITDPTMRALTLETGGPDNLTFNQLAVAVQKSARREKTPRHVPRPVLWMMAHVLGAIRPEIARQGRAALSMDTESFSFAPAEIHRRCPDLPITSVSDVLAQRWGECRVSSP